MLRPGEAIYLAWKRQFDIEGRSRRSEYWWTQFFIILLTIALLYVDDLIFSNGVFDATYEVNDLTYLQSFLQDFNFYPTSNLVYLLTIPMTFTVGMRRLHDVGRSGWPAVLLSVLALISGYIPSDIYMVTFSGSETNYSKLIPLLLMYFAIVVLSIYVLILSIRDSHRTENQYGASPKYGSQKAVFD